MQSDKIFSVNHNPYGLRKFHTLFIIQIKAMRCCYFTYLILYITVPKHGTTFHPHVTSAPSHMVFTQRLKTFLFSHSYLVDILI